ncbi:unnamed protein product, partial [Amoebophrya sp. A25]
RRNVSDKNPRKGFPDLLIGFASSSSFFQKTGHRREAPSVSTWRLFDKTARASVIHLLPLLSFREIRERGRRRLVFPWLGSSLFQFGRPVFCWPGCSCVLRLLMRSPRVLLS